MKYQKMKCNKILKELDSEEQARAWIWLAKFDGKEFTCPKCNGENFYQHKKNPEIRECKDCHLYVRLRANTIFQNSKIPMLIWLKAICLMTQGKRGISALEIQSELEMKSYGTAWNMLHKIREALRQRDESYKISNIIELDGGVFGRRQTGNQSEVLIAVETKEWIDKRGKKKSRAGFAKVLVANETKAAAQNFVDDAVDENATLRTDNSPSFSNLENIDVEHKTVGTDKELLDSWLPWVHQELEVKERRQQTRKGHYAKPELLATMPNQVWSWDITKLLAANKWSYFYLYVILDIFSRYVVGWMVADRESSELAKYLIQRTCQKQQIPQGQLTLHADRGSSMKSKPVALLLADLGVTKTHSRPYTSDDNPYSESQFKTSS